MNEPHFTVTPKQHIESVLIEFFNLNHFRMKKIFNLLIVAAISAFLFTACSDQDDPVPLKDQKAGPQQDQPVEGDV